MKTRTVEVTTTLELLGDGESQPKHDLRVNLGDLSGPLGNAHAVLGVVGVAIRRHAGPEAEAAYLSEARSGDYANLLRVTSEHVEAVATNVPDLD